MDPEGSLTFGDCVLTMLAIFFLMIGGAVVTMGWKVLASTEQKHQEQQQKETEEQQKHLEQQQKSYEEQQKNHRQQGCDVGSQGPLTYARKRATSRMLVLGEEAWG